MITYCVLNNKYNSCGKQICCHECLKQQCDIRCLDCLAECKWAEKREEDENE